MKLIIIIISTLVIFGSCARIKSRDANLTTDELIRKYGYKCETHYAETPDGYLLALHRIPTLGGRPVYLQHGLLDSSAGWVIMGPKKSFAYHLNSLGYDVWLGNARGNRYSRQHIRLKPENKEFWEFTFHEMGMFDLPTIIDYIITNTGHEKIHYIGHSQGTTSFWVMCSHRPGYCEKIISMQALAPVAFLSDVRSPLIQILSQYIEHVDTIMEIVGHYEFLANHDILRYAGFDDCEIEGYNKKLCNNILFLITGYDSQQLNSTSIPTILGHLPAGTSTKNMIHYGQICKYGIFRMFNYRVEENMRRYGKIDPPEYYLGDVSTPVALYYSENDWLTAKRDVDSLRAYLPNVVKHFLVPDPKFNHLDFLLAKNVKQLVYKEVVKSMKKAEILTFEDYGDY